VTVTETRQPTGNWRPAPPPVFNAPASVVGVIGALVAVHLFLWLMGEDAQVWALYWLSLVPSRFTDPNFPMPPGSQYWTLLTYALLHGDWMHILFNSLWLLIFGTPVARYLGHSRFLLVCLVSSVVGGAASLALHWGEQVFVVGASGAVSGLIGAAIPIMYAVRYPGGGGRPLWFGELLRSRNALTFMAIWLFVTLLSGASGWTGNGFVTDSGIAWEAHLGGFAGGLACFYALTRRQVRRA
jgi:membrane associated rhomboid family serine protease